MRNAGTPRHLALEVLGRIERDGAYANLALRSALDRCDLDRRDRAFVTNLVYGTTRMRRACDHLLDRFLEHRVEPAVRTVLRMGVYQLHWAGVPVHAAVDATVSEAPRRARGLCNAVLRRVAGYRPDWPSQAVEHSYPDWLFDRLVADLGSDDALSALAAMNEPVAPVVRNDGYRQDQASQLVAALVADGIRPDEGPVLDVCAAPGGKATALASGGALVVAGDISPGRLRLVGDNSRNLGLPLSLVAADGLRPPFALGAFQSVLVDAPCSGLGVLRRRVDARWRVAESDISDLAALQLALLEAVFPLLAPGGLLFYSVCTVTTAETVGVDEAFRAVTGARSAGPLPEPWRPHGLGGLLLPQDLDSEGMAVFVYRAG